MHYYRWSDNDVRKGPFIYARDTRGYRPFGVTLSSRGDEDETSFSTLRVSLFGHTFIAIIPSVIKPSRSWVDTSKHAWSNSPNGGYWNIEPREFGFSLSDGHLSVLYGRQTHDSSTEQRWGMFLPWTQWRHVRHSLYDLRGELFYTLPKTTWKLGDAVRHNRWIVESAIRDACPTVSFEFDDFDGERIVATAKIEEREWLFGEGYFKWLSLFRRRKIRRSLDLSFSKEVGKRKGSWKGGTVGHSIDMLAGELHQDAFRRYCTKENMTFVAKAIEARSGETGTGSTEGESAAPSGVCPKVSQ